MFLYIYTYYEIPAVVQANATNQSHKNIVINPFLEVDLV